MEDDPMARFILSIHESSRMRDRQAQVWAWFRFAVLGTIIVLMMAFNFSDHNTQLDPVHGTFAAAPDCTIIPRMIDDSWWGVCVEGNPLPLYTEQSQDRIPGMMINGVLAEHVTVMPAEPQRP